MSVLVGEHPRRTLAPVSDTTPDVDCEGDDLDHDVPVELVELHEILEWQQAAAKGPNE